MTMMMTKAGCLCSYATRMMAGTGFGTVQKKRAGFGSEVGAVCFGGGSSVIVVDIGLAPVAEIVAAAAPECSYWVLMTGCDCDCGCGCRCLGKNRQVFEGRSLFETAAVLAVAVVTVVTADRWKSVLGTDLGEAGLGYAVGTDSMRRAGLVSVVGTD